MLQYDDTQLQRLYRELDEKRRLKSMRGAFKREAGRVRKTALDNLRGSISTDRDLESGVRAIVFKQKAGFRVTIGTKKAKRGSNNGPGLGFHKSRQNPKQSPKPVLIWAESGTEARKTKSKTRVFTRSRKGHSTGRMKRYGFMAKTQRQVVGTVTDSLHREVVRNVERIAKKYGCN